MVRFMGMCSDAQSIKSGYLDEMFDAGTWKVRNIWDGVKLEVGEDESPVVLNSFTHLDPDLPLFEVIRLLIIPHTCHHRLAHLRLMTLTWTPSPP
uniref:Uncharacterized protein n=1 Tax=Oncorhynchus tshawytscha TaxID=74940 RepID=A0AAZ3PLI0_ONCTS